MGRRGPKRTPLGILETRGSRLPTRQQREELSHVDGDLECPDWCGPYGRQMWNYLYPKLRAVSGLLKPAYLLDFAILCRAYNDLREAIDEIDRDGPTCISEKGAPYQHPAAGRKNKAIEQIAKFGPRFGLNPADATNFNPGDGDDGKSDPFSELMGGIN